MYSLDLCERNGIFVLIFQDRITVSDGRRAFLDVINHPGFDPMVPILADLRGVTDLAVDFPGMFMAVQAVLKHIRRFSAQSKTVLLTGNDMQYGTARMLQQVVEAVSQLRFTVVDSTDEAAAKLGLSVADLETLTRAPDQPLPGAAPRA